MKNSESGRSRGFGFVTFADPSNVNIVLQNGPHQLDGRTVINGQFLLYDLNLIGFCFSYSNYKYFSLIRLIQKPVHHARCRRKKEEITILKYSLVAYHQILQKLIYDYFSVAMEK